MLNGNYSSCASVYCTHITYYSCVCVAMSSKNDLFQSSGSTFSHYYDVTKVMSKESIARADVISYDACSGDRQLSSDSDPRLRHHILRDLIARINDVIKECSLSTDPGKPPSNVLRIGMAYGGGGEHRHFLLTYRHACWCHTQALVST